MGVIERKSELELEIEIRKNGEENNQIDIKYERSLQFIFTEKRTGQRAILTYRQKKALQNV